MFTSGIPVLQEEMWLHFGANGQKILLVLHRSVGCTWIAGSYTLISRWKEIDHESLISNQTSRCLIFLIWILPTWISWVLLIITKDPSPLSSSCPWTFFPRYNMGFYAKFQATICIVVVQKCQNLKGGTTWVLGLTVLAWSLWHISCHLHRRVVVCNTAQNC